MFFSIAGCPSRRSGSLWVDRHHPLGRGSGLLSGGGEGGEGGEGGGGEICGAQWSALLLQLPRTVYSLLYYGGSPVSRGKTGICGHFYYKATSFSQSQLEDNQPTKKQPTSCNNLVQFSTFTGKVENDGSLYTIFFSETV